MNTPDTEWEREFEVQFTWLSDGANDNIKNFIQSLLTSRDTYWKERVRDIRFMDLPEIVLTKEECKKRGIETEWDFTVFVKRGDVDTLLDNLK